MKLVNINSAIIPILFFLSVLLGINLADNYPYTISYFHIPFADYLNVVVTLVMGVFVAHYIGNKLSDLGKLKEIRLQTLNKFEDQFEKIFDYLDRRVKQKDLSVAEKLPSLFDNIFSILQSCMEESEVSKGNSKYYKSIDSINSEIKRLWELTTADPLNDLNKNYTASSISEIYAIKHSIATKVHTSKLAIYS